jgi:Uma2 family endonuclease
MSALLQPVRPTYTAHDLERLTSNGLRFELIRGELFEMSPPGMEHARRTQRLGRYVGNYIEEHGLGEDFAEAGFIVSRNPDTVLSPDWAFISKDRLPETPETSYAEVIPDIVLETRSPNDLPKEVALKVDRWLQAGVKIAWELDPATHILAVHRLGMESRFLKPTDTLTGEEVLPGFELPLSKVFPEV